MFWCSLFFFFWILKLYYKIIIIVFLFIICDFLWVESDCELERGFLGLDVIFLRRSGLFVKYIIYIRLNIYKVIMRN